MIEWFVATAIGIVLVIVAYNIVFIVSKKLTMKNNGDSGPPNEMWRSSIIVSPIISIFAMVFIAVASVGNLVEWGFIIPTNDVVLIFIIVGLLAAIPATVLEELSKSPNSKSKGTVTRNNLGAYIVLVIIFASIAEELLFRGFLQQIIDKMFLISIDINGGHLTSGAIVGALLFGFVHAMPAKMMGNKVPPLVLAAFLLGITAGIGLATSGSILMPIIIHMEFNIVGAIIPRVLHAAS
jgi:membrane protease YdiL (CAAX protease family)